MRLSDTTFLVGFLVSPNEFQLPPRAGKNLHPNIFADDILPRSTRRETNEADSRGNLRDLKSICFPLRYLHKRAVYGSSVSFFFILERIARLSQRSSGTHVCGYRDEARGKKVAAR